jgi:hypothetical protein
MSVIRQANLLGQQRLDIPHLRAIESSVAADFDLLAGQIMAGKNPLVVQGFNLIGLPAGTPASQLQLQVAASVILHPEASESGTIFQVPAARAPETLNASNARVQGGFTANSVNYIGIDLRRTADASTADLVQFLDADTSLENPKTVPLGRTLDYVIVISTQDFSTTPGVAPLAKVTTDAFNNIATNGIEDARNLTFRLATGGTITDWKHQFPWPGGRGEPGSNGAQPNSDFTSGDKSITSLKDWIDAAMTRIWELGGGEYWYSATADRNVKLFRAGSTFTNGDWFSWDGTNLLWKGLTVIFDNSTGTFNQIADQTSSLPGLTNLADGECIYVDLDRTQNRSGGNALQPVKAQLSTLGVPVTPGARLVLAWRRGSGNQAVVTRDAQFPVNATFVVATTVSTGVVQLHAASTTPTSPLVLTDGDFDVANGVVALNANKQASIVATSGIALTTISGANSDGAHITGVGSGIGLKVVGGSSGAWALNAVGGNDWVGGGSGGGIQTQPGQNSGISLSVKNGGDFNADILVRTENSRSKPRFIIDSQGFPSGQRVEYRHGWWNNLPNTTSSGTFGSAYLGWTATISGGSSSIETRVVDGLYPAPMMKAVVSAGTSGDGTICYTNQKVYSNKLSDTTLVWETTVITGAALTANQVYQVGLSDDTPTAASTKFIRFSCGGSGNWRAQLKNGTTLTDIDTTVAPVAGVPVRLKIVYRGQSATFGHPDVTWYINGVQRGYAVSDTADVPSSNDFYFYWLAFNTGAAGGGTNLAIGNIIAHWNIADSTIA